MIKKTLFIVTVGIFFNIQVAAAACPPFGPKACSNETPSSFSCKRKKNPQQPCEQNFRINPPPSRYYPRCDSPCVDYCYSPYNYSTRDRLEAQRECYSENWACNFIDDVRRDFCVYFQRDNLLAFSAFFVTAGIFANTGLDKSIRNAWQDNCNQRTNNCWNKAKFFGDIGYYYFPLFFGTMLIGHWTDDTLFGNVLYHWGYRCLRTTILGGVQVGILTVALGSGRPCQGRPSKWQPFKYRNGVSGHAHYGAIPFLTAAMMTDPPVLKYALYIASTLPGLSRLEHDCHYFSQVLLGWGIAFLSARAVYNSDLERDTFQVSLYPKDRGAGCMACWKF